MVAKPIPKPESEREGIGRPSKFTPERCAAIVSAIRSRVPYEYAAEGNGICEDTLYEWLKIARQHKSEQMETEYTRFSESIKRAEMERIVEHNNNIAGHVDKWQGDAWILERRWYKHYGSNAPIMELNQRLAKLENGESNEKRNEESSEKESKEE